MAKNLSFCLIAAMERLWFQQSILFPETQLQPQVLTYSESDFSSRLALSSVVDQQEPALDDSKNGEEQTKKRSRTGNHSRLHPSPSSPPTQKLRIYTRCRSLKDLEQEEVKGFMDLGFIFTKEHLNPTMIRIVPGLLRLGFPTRIKSTEHHELQTDDGVEQEEKKRVVIRPYLSEAWLIKRPDSPLLNLRVPRVSAAADMKKHLKCWARTVASVVQQESYK